MLAEQDADIAPRHPIVVEALDLGSHPAGLVDRGPEPPGPHRSFLGIVEGPKVAEVAGARDLVAHPIGEVDHPNGRASVEGEVHGLGGCAVFTREVDGEVGEVLERGPSPLVDGLVGVAHCRHREAVAEHRPQHLALSGIGVLVLVQQHHPVPAADASGDLGMLVHQSMGGGDEVGVVDDAEGCLATPVGQEGVCHLATAGCDISIVIGVCEVSRVEQMVTQLACQRRQFVDPTARRSEIEGGVLSVAEGIPQQLAGVAGSDDRCRAFDAHDGSELAQEAVGEPVVGGDLDLPALLGEVGEFGAEFGCEFLGCLVGEGDAEGLLGFHLPALDQVAETERHRRGLAGSGTRGDAEWEQRVLDDPLLFGCGDDRHPR